MQRVGQLGSFAPFGLSGSASPSTAAQWNAEQTGAATPSVAGPSNLGTQAGSTLTPSSSSSLDFLGPEFGAAIGGMSIGGIAGLGIGIFLAYKYGGGKVFNYVIAGWLGAFAGAMVGSTVAGTIVSSSSSSSS